MEKRFYEYSTNKYFFDSADVKLFPSAYRETRVAPEAKLNTEFNLTHVGGSGLGKNSSYIISNEVGENNNFSVLKLFLNGYYFEITYSLNDMNLLFQNGNNIYLYLKTIPVPLADSQQTTATTYILESLKADSAPGSILDQVDPDLATVYYFTGLFLTNTLDGLSLGTALQIFKRNNSTGNFELYQQNKLPHVYNGEGNYAIVLGENTPEKMPTGKNAICEGDTTKAAGTNAHALGQSTYATGNNQIAYGKYNIEDTNNKYIEIVGNGQDDGHRANARTLDWDGNEILSGTITARIDNSAATSYKTVIVDANGKLLKKDISKITDVIAVPEANNTTTITYVDTVHEDANGHITETRKTTTISDGLTAQGTFCFNGTDNIKVKDLGSIDTPTFNNTHISALTKNTVVLVNNNDDANDKTLVSRAISDSNTAAALQASSNNFCTERDIYNGLPIINNTHNYTSASTLFAPTTGGNLGELLVALNSTSAPSWLSAGANGQILKSNGSNQAISWASVTSANNTATWGNEIIVGNVAGTDLKFTMPADPASWRPVKINNDNILDDNVNNQYPLHLVNGNNISITADNEKNITISTVDIKYDTAGNQSWTASSAETVRYLIGCESYSNTAHTYADTNAIKNVFVNNDGLNAAGLVTTNGSLKLNYTSGFYTLAADSTKQGITTDSNFYVGNDCSANAFYARSDERLKQNITDYKCKKSILELPIKEYKYINDKKHTKHIGCIAQDLQEICPELVTTDSNGMLNIEETKLVYLLIDEVKELKTKLNIVEQKLKRGNK